MRATPAGWPTDTAVTRPHAEVVIDGTTREATSVSTSQELSTDLPVQMYAAPGETVESATLNLRSGDVVSSRSPTPWLDSWVRDLYGKSCTVRMGYGSALVNVLTGQVSDIDGQTGAPEIGVQVDGAGAWLGAPVSVEPRFAVDHIVHFESGDTVRAAHVGLTPLAILDHLARGGGYHSMPEPDESTSLFVPMQSTLRPEIGHIVAASSPVPTWEAAPWGWGVWTAAAISAKWGLLPGPLDETGVFDTQVTAWASTAADLTVSMPVGPGVAATYIVRLYVEATGVRVTEQDLSPLGPETEILSILGTFDGPVTLRLTSTTAELTAPDGTTDSAAYSQSTRIQNVITVAGQCAGLTVSRSDLGTLPNPPTLLSFTATFLADPSLADIDASPWVDEQPRWQVMTEIAVAEGGAIIATGDGALRFLNRDTLVSSASVATVTVADLASLGWRVSPDQVRTSVRVGYIPADINLNTLARYVAWQPDEDIVLPQGETVTIITDMLVDAAEGLDTGVSFVTSGWVVARSAVYAWRSDVADLYVGTTTGQDLSDELSISVRQLAPNRLRVDMLWEPKNSPAASVVVNLQRRSPQIRAAQTLTWLDEESVTVETGVTLDTGSRELVVPASYWRQSLSDTKTWTQYLAARAGISQPSVEWVDVAAPDPRLEVGDVIRATDADVTGVDARALIVGQKLGWDGERLTQRLGLRLMPWLISDFDTTYTGDTIADFDTAWTGKTIADFDADPLGRYL